MDRRKIKPIEEKIFALLYFIKAEGNLNPFDANDIIMRIFGIKKTKAREYIMLWVRNYNDQGKYKDITLFYV
tara:strand:+ start:1426 stop:1641 length:216 start_codon:yes stop_codon:yes gene_type:complete